MILYISKEIDDNIGARLHQRAIRNIIGEKEVFTIYLSPAINQVKQTNYILLDFFILPQHFRYKKAIDACFSIRSTFNYIDFV